jgi:hypothetical protein
MYFAMRGSKTLPTMIRVETKKTQAGQGLQFLYHKQSYHTATDTITGIKNSHFVVFLNRDNLF